SCAARDKWPLAPGRLGWRSARLLGRLDGAGRNVSDARRAPRRIRSRSSRTTCAAVCVSRNTEGRGRKRNETVSWLYLYWLGDRAGDHVRRRAPGHAWQCWNLAANQYRHFHSVVRGAWCLAAQTRCQYSPRASSRSCGSLTTLRLLLGRRVKIVMAVFAAASASTLSTCNRCIRARFVCCNLK